MSSAITDDEHQRWVPTHVQVTVLRARGLRAKGKHGTSDAYVIIQVGKEKYSTCVMEKTTEPEWGEECTFELQPGVLEPGGRDVCSPGSCDLTLTAMHRALIGLDVFLGQTVIPLDKAFQDRISMKKEWHRMHSKTGKKEKERGEVQVTVQFTRHNLTASMYDLSMKDKPHSAFGKLKERIRGKKHLGDEDSASAIIPGGYGALARMRGRLPSDGGGEEYYEDDEGGEARRSKMRNFFLRGRLRKSSDTRSSTSLGSESSESSSRGGSLSPTAGISVVVSDLSNSPSNSSNLTADNSPEHTVAPSPQVSPHKRIYDDEVCEISIPVPQSFTYESLIPETAPSSTAVANGHPVKHAAAPRAPKPEPKPSAPAKQGGTSAAPKAMSLSLSPAVGTLQKASAMSLSLQNLSVSRRVEEPHPGPGDGRRWSLDKAGEEERAAIAAAIENAGKLEEEERRAAQFKKEATPAVTVGDGEVKKQKWGLFSHGRSDSAGKAASTGKGDSASGPAEGKHKGWFGSKDSHNKPSPVPSISLSDATHHQEWPVTEETPPGDVNRIAHQPKEVTVMSNESVNTNPFISDMDWDQALNPEDASQAPIFQVPPMHANPQSTATDTNFAALTSLTTLTNTTTSDTQDLSQLSPNVSQMSLPQNISIDFSEMHTLASPYPGTLLDTQGSSDTYLNETSPSQMPLGNASNSQLAASTTTWLTQPDQSVEMSGTPEGVLPESTELESAISTSNIDLNGRQADLESVFSSSVAEVVSEMTYTPSKDRRLSAYKDMGSDDSDASDTSTIVSYSPGRELDQHASDPLPTWQAFKMEHEIDDDKEKTSDVEVMVPVLDGSDLGDTDTTSKQEIGFGTVNEVFGWENMGPSGGSSVQALDGTDPQSVSSGNHILNHSLEAENPFSGSLVCVMASSPGETLISSESRFTGDSALLRGSELPSSPTRVLQDMSPDDKHFDTSFSTHKLETPHKTLESPVSLLPSVSFSSNVNANNSGNPFVSAVSDTFVNPIVSIGPNDSNSTSAPFFSLNSDSFCASSHNSSTSPNKDLLLAPQSTRFLGSLLYESAESDCYHSCNSLHRHASFYSVNSLPLQTTKDPLEQLIASYDLAVKTQPSKDPFHSSRQINDPKTDDVSQFNLSPLSPPTTNLPMNSSPVNLTTTCITQEATPNQKSSELLQRDNLAENFANPFPEDPFPDILWMSNLKDKTLSEQWPSQQSMLACDRTTEFMPNYELMEGVVPNSDLTQKDMPKSVPFQEVPATKDIEINPFLSDRFVKSPKDSVSGSPLTGESEVQGFSEFSVDWANFDKLATESSSGKQKEVLPQEGASVLNDLASPPSWLTSENPYDINTRPGVGFDQSRPDLSIGVSDGTPPSSSITQDLVITHLQSQTDTHTNPKSSQGEPDLLGSTGEPLQAFPEVTGTPADMKTDLKLTFKPELLPLSPLASSTPAADQPPLSFPAVTPALGTPSHPSPTTIARDLIGASQEQQQPSNLIASPHPVKPLTPPGEEKKSESRSVLEKLKSTIHPGRSQSDSDKKNLVEGGGSYYHLNHSELVSLLLQREADLQRERAEFERRGVLLEKREMELRKTKVLIRDLEDYIDRLLVRIMAEKPLLLQQSK